jgi:hypothetical protein
MAVLHHEARGAEQYVVEIESLRRPSDTDAATFMAPAERGIARRGFAGIITVGEYDDVASIRRKIECAKT